eukprot:3813551-Lingulodinium_polyedra.AAC.1
MPYLFPSTAIADTCCCPPCSNNEDPCADGLCKSSSGHVQKPEHLKSSMETLTWHMACQPMQHFVGRGHGWLKVAPVLGQAGHTHMTEQAMAIACPKDYTTGKQPNPSTTTGIGVGNPIGEQAFGHQGSKGVGWWLGQH